MEPFPPDVYLALGLDSDLKASRQERKLVHACAHPNDAALWFGVEVNQAAPLLL